MSPGMDAHESLGHPSGTTSKRILIVDDNLEMVQSLCDIVELQGWVPAGTGSGEAALRMFGEASYDAVLMDIRMPGMNGVEALRAIKQLRPALPVILMTAYTPHELVDQAYAEGALEVLAKPLALDTLFSLLEQIAER